MVSSFKEYVVNEILRKLDVHNGILDELRKEIKKLEKENRNMKNLLNDNNICYECVCSKCNRVCMKYPFVDKDHFHNQYKEFPVLCYMCFFEIFGNEGYVSL